MHVSLTDKLDEYVRGKVADGLYNNASEVIREALRTKMQQETERAASLTMLRNEVGIGIEQADNGEFADYSLQKSLNTLGVD